MQQHPRLPRQLEINISDNIFDLSIKLRAVEGLLDTMYKLDILTHAEVFHLYIGIQRKTISNMRVD